MKLWATIKKDMRLLLRDKVGLSLMFGMPILLVIVVTGIQSNTFELLNKNSIALAVCNKDTGVAARQFMSAIEKTGMFRVVNVPANKQEAEVKNYIRTEKMMLGVVLPADFSSKISASAKVTAGKALASFGLDGDSVRAAAPVRDAGSAITLYYSPVLQESYKRSIQGALGSALQMVESGEVLKSLYFSINEKPLPDSLQREMMSNSVQINEEPLLINGNRMTPNASQHNVPSWTIFAMFFVVMSLGGSVVQEKLNGSFIRLKTLPTNYYVAMVSKQITYLAVTMLQATIIFTVGICLFPLMGLPLLRLPADIGALVAVTLVCGWCAVSYAICVGVFAHTREQANGFGATSIVILAVIGGLMVPDFAMPGTFQTMMKISPLHWCLEAYYGLFLEGGTLDDVVVNILPLLFITLLIQALIFIGLKRKRLI